MEFTQTDCQQGHVSPSSTGGRCIGWFWNFGNASAIDYYIEHLVTPLALSPTIDGVFYDAFNYVYYYIFQPCTVALPSQQVALFNPFWGGLGTCSFWRFLASVDHLLLCSRAARSRTTRHRLNRSVLQYDKPAY